MPTTGRSGYSLEEFIRKVLLHMLRWRSKQCCHARELTSWAAVYNTLHSGGPPAPTHKLPKTPCGSHAAPGVRTVTPDLKLPEAKLQEGRPAPITTNNTS